MFSFGEPMRLFLIALIALAGCSQSFTIDGMEYDRCYVSDAYYCPDKNLKPARLYVQRCMSKIDWGKVKIYSENSILSDTGFNVPDSRYIDKAIKTLNGCKRGVDSALQKKYCTKIETGRCW
jgi:hypothetical protein